MFNSANGQWLEPALSSAVKKGRASEVLYTILNYYEYKKTKVDILKIWEVFIRLNHDKITSTSIQKNESQKDTSMVLSNAWAFAV